MGDDLSGSADPRSEAERLQAQSNRNRIEFLLTELDTCFTLAGVAETEQNAGNPGRALQSLQHAEIAYATIVQFMSDPKHRKHITEQERRDLTAGLEGLRSTLDWLAKRRKR